MLSPPLPCLAVMECMHTSDCEPAIRKIANAILQKGTVIERGEPRGLEKCLGIQVDFEVVLIWVPITVTKHHRLGSLNSKWIYCLTSGG